MKEQPVSSSTDLPTAPAAPPIHYLGQPVHCVVRVDGQGYVPAAMTGVREHEAFVLWSHVNGSWVPLEDVYPA